MIRYLKAKNHKGISELKLMNLGRINIICGKNNSGKTSILEAINSNDKIAIGEKIEDIESLKKNFFSYIQNFARPRPEELMRWFQEYTYQLIGDDTILFDDEVVEKFQKGLNNDPHLSGYTNLNVNFNALFNDFFQKERNYFKPILIPPKRTLEPEVKISLGQSVTPAGTGLNNKLFYLKNQVVESAEFEMYKRIYDAFHEITGYQFNIIPSQEDKITLKFRKGDDKWITCDACGLGLSDALVIIYFVVSPERTIILIEEPESHVHPDMQRKLLYFLRKTTEKQFILTTHSNVFLNNALVDRVFFTTMNDCVQVNDVTSRASILDDLGYSVADNLVSDLVILVEGPNDVPVLEEYFIKMGLFAKFNIKIWPMGGDIMDRVDLNVFAENYKILALIDKDPKSVKIRNRFKKKCKENGIEVIQLKRYSIENYFTARVLKEVFGQLIPESLTIVEANKKLDEQIGFEAKRNNRKLAKTMTEEELKDTDDLYRFLLKVKERCEE